MGAWVGLRRIVQWLNDARPKTVSAAEQLGERFSAPRPNDAQRPSSPASSSQYAQQSATGASEAASRTCPIRFFPSGGLFGLLDAAPGLEIY